MSDATLLVDVKRKPAAAARAELVSAPTPFAPLDAEKMAEDLDLERFAREEGWKELPATDSTEPSPTERRIRSQFVEAVSDYNQVLESGLQAKSLQINALAGKVKKNADDARNVPSFLDIEARKFEDKYGKLIRQKKADSAAVEQEYLKFREEAGLDRPAHDPRGRLDSVIIYLVFFVLIAVEAICNAGLFATNLDGGLMAGGLMALLFSLINGATGFFVGRCLMPWLHVRRWRWWAASGVGLWAVLLVAYGFVVAQYRDCLQLDIDSPQAQALANFLSHPFALSDIFSYLLLALTVFIGAMAAREGFRSNEDPYPGYAAISRKLSEKSAEWRRCVAQGQAFIEKTHGEMEKQLEDCSNAADAAAQQIQLCMKDKSLIIVQYEAAVEKAQAAVEGLILRFREKNAHERKTKAPAYFDAGVSVDRDCVRTDFDQAPDEQLLAECKQQVEALKADFPQIQKQLIARYQALLQTWSK